MTHLQVYTSRTRRITKRGQRLLILWTISAVLLLMAGLLVRDAVLQASPIGLLVSGSWMATILVNSIFFDYLLRQKNR